MVSLPDIIKDNIPLDVGTPGTMKNPSARNLLSQFLEILDVTLKNDVHRLVSAKNVQGHTHSQ